MSNTEKIKVILTDGRVQLLITVISMVIVIINFLIINRLTPVAKDLDNLTKRVDAIDNHYVRDETFEAVVERINHISNRVDQIYGFLK